jgi:hypothetical protein
MKKENEMSALIASLTLLLALTVAGLAHGVAGVDLHDLVRLLDREPAAAYFNAWPAKYCGC